MRGHRSSARPAVRRIALLRDTAREASGAQLACTPAPRPPSAAGQPPQPLTSRFLYLKSEEVDSQTHTQRWRRDASGPGEQGRGAHCRGGARPLLTRPSFLAQGMITLILATDMARHAEIMDSFKEKMEDFDYSCEEHTTLVSRLALFTPLGGGWRMGAPPSSDWKPRTRRSARPQSEASAEPGFPVGKAACRAPRPSLHRIPA